jgi:hypothetical protein
MGDSLIFSLFGKEITQLSEVDIVNFFQDEQTENDLLALAKSAVLFNHVFIPVDIFSYHG